MCGIFGWVRFGDGFAAGEIESARAATQKMIHRGPDAFGEWTDRRVYLGHQRLSILDLSEAAAQPFLGGDRYVLVFNGEIYNYIELRQELERDGHEFRTESDTEVLLHVLAAWGVNGLRRLDGMFAGALYDRETAEHLVFRDPLGQKPLYMHLYDGGVVFASELRSLLALPQFRWRLDRQAFRRFLAHSYYPWRSTPIAGVEKLLPGCLLRIQRQTVRHERWWESVPGADPLDLSVAEARSEFERLFDRSCRISMRSDVPVGVFLSGGIDSTLVLGSCHDASPDVQAFSVSMAEADYDESGKAAVAAAQIGVRARSFTLDEDALHASFSELMGVLDEPHGDPGYVNTYFLAQSCRPHITVALAGDGADELFAGYAPFAGVATAAVLEHMPAPVAAAARAAAGLIPATDGYLGLQFKALAYLQGFPAHPSNRHGLWLSSLPPDALSRLLPGADNAFFDPMRPDGAFDVLETDTRPESGIQRMLQYYQKVFLPEFVCHHTDRAAMLHSLEVRAPFLSVPLIEFANRLPDSVKMQGRVLKRLLRESLRERGYPAQLVDQRKQGFTFPVARWLKRRLRGLVDDLVATGDLQQLTGGEISVPVLRRIIDLHMSGRCNYYRIIYNLVVFRAWRQRYAHLDFQ